MTKGYCISALMKFDRTIKKKRLLSTSKEKLISEVNGYEDLNTMSLHESFRVDDLIITKVPAGWLYCTMVGEKPVATTFVPYPNYL